MTLVKQSGPGDKLLVDVGNLTSGSRSYELLKLHYLLEGMNRTGYQAVNLGRKEAGLDRETLQKIVVENRVPFVSCNVLDKKTHRPLAETYRIIGAAGVRIAITGVAEMPDDEIGPGIEIRPSVEALADLLPKLKTEAGFIVVLAFVGTYILVVKLASITRKDELNLDIRFHLFKRFSDQFEIPERIVSGMVGAVEIRVAEPARLAIG